MQRGQHDISVPTFSPQTPRAANQEFSVFALRFSFFLAFSSPGQANASKLSQPGIEICALRVPI
jgi:hypothetical protein